MDFDEEEEEVIVTELIDVDLTQQKADDTTGSPNITTHAHPSAAIPVDGPSSAVHLVPSPNSDLKAAENKPEENGHAQQMTKTGDFYFGADDDDEVIVTSIDTPIASGSGNPDDEIKMVLYWHTTYMQQSSNSEKKSINCKKERLNWSRKSDEFQPLVVVYTVYRKTL